ncbi:MAG: DUF4843 domain-containing protein [Odoribacter sp.]|nr:DUF4843 domain-containing protein [Odoribacter sp.]
MKKQITYSIILFFTVLIAVSCNEDEIETIDTTKSSLNFLKGTINDVDYPDSTSFNAYFLGVGAGDYTLYIPVRLSGAIDYENDREYKITFDKEKSGATYQEEKYPLMNGKEFSFSEIQLLKKGAFQDSIAITIHVQALIDSIENYRLYVKLEPYGDFEAGVDDYQYYTVDFMKNLDNPPNFWLNDSKLNKLTYHPRKCAVFLEISGITDPDWKVATSSTAELSYWIESATLWFQQNEVIDENGNRIYFDQ